MSDPIRDRAQVLSAVHHLAVMDKRCALDPLLRQPGGLTVEQQNACLREEAWILGAGMRDYIQRHFSTVG